MTTTNYINVGLAAFTLAAWGISWLLHRSTQRLLAQTQDLLAQATAARTVVEDGLIVVEEGNKVVDAALRYFDGQISREQFQEAYNRFAQGKKV